MAQADKQRGWQPLRVVCTACRLLLSGRGDGGKAGVQARQRVRIVGAAEQRQTHSSYSNNSKAEQPHSRTLARWAVWLRWRAERGGLKRSLLCCTALSTVGSVGLIRVVGPLCYLSNTHNARMMPYLTIADALARHTAQQITN